MNNESKNKKNEKEYINIPCIITRDGISHSIINFARRGSSKFRRAEFNYFTERKFDVPAAINWEAPQIKENYTRI